MAAASRNMKRTVLVSANRSSLLAVRSNYGHKDKISHASGDELELGHGNSLLAVYRKERKMALNCRGPKSVKSDAF